MNTRTMPCSSLPCKHHTYDYHGNDDKRFWPWISAVSSLCPSLTVCVRVGEGTLVGPSFVWWGDVYLDTLWSYCNDGHQGPRDEMDLLLKYSVSQNPGVGMELGKMSQKQGVCFPLWYLMASIKGWCWCLWEREVKKRIVNQVLCSSLQFFWPPG